MHTDMTNILTMKANQMVMETITMVFKMEHLEDKISIR